MSLKTLFRSTNPLLLNLISLTSFGLRNLKREERSTQVCKTKSTPLSSSDHRKQGWQHQGKSLCPTWHTDCNILYFTKTYPPSRRPDHSTCRVLLYFPHGWKRKIWKRRGGSVLWPKSNWRDARSLLFSPFPDHQTWKAQDAMSDDILFTCLSKLHGRWCPLSCKHALFSFHDTLSSL